MHQVTILPHRSRSSVPTEPLAALVPRDLRSDGAITEVRAEPIPASEAALRWFDLTAETVSAVVAPAPITSSRIWALSWLAAARAVSEGSDTERATAAFASALHDMLVAMVPSQRSALDDALAGTVQAIPDGPARSRGIAAGRVAADRTLNAATADMTEAASGDAPWTPPPAMPGVWRPTAPFARGAVHAGQWHGAPFLLGANGRLRPGPPPALDAQMHLDDLAEVQDVGGLHSLVRAPEQTSVARFWAGSPMSAYTQVLREILARSRRPLAWRVRLVAAFHVITVDAQLAVFEAKHAYAGWRPVSAIREGDIDPDPSWTPLIGTPSHPGYPSGHTGYAGAAQRILEALVGPAATVPIVLTSATAPGVARTHTEWATLTRELIDGRVWGGVQLRSSSETGAELGRHVANYDLLRLWRLGL